MWQLPAPCLPMTQHEAETWLFARLVPKVPVTNQYFQEMKTARPAAASELLMPGGEAHVAVACTACLSEPLGRFTSRAHTSQHVQRFMSAAFKQLECWGRYRLDYDLFLNDAHKDSSYTCRFHMASMRPDAMVVVNSYTLLLGEEKHCSLSDAIRDLEKKRVGIRPRHYKDVNFMLGYAAAKTLFQWFFIPKSASQVCLLPDTFGTSALPSVDQHSEAGTPEMTCVSDIPRGTPGMIPGRWQLPLLLHRTA